MVPAFSCRFPRRLFYQFSILLRLRRLGLWRKRSSSQPESWENRAEPEVEEEGRESPPRILRGPLKETTLTLWRRLCVRSPPSPKKCSRWPFEGCQSNRHLHVKDGLLTSNQAPARFLLRSRMSNRPQRQKKARFWRSSGLLWAERLLSVWELFLHLLRSFLSTTAQTMCVFVWSLLCFRLCVWPGSSFRSYTHGELFLALWDFVITN